MHCRRIAGWLDGQADGKGKQIDENWQQTVEQMRKRMDGGRAGEVNGSQSSWLRHIRSAMSTDTAKIVACVIVNSRLDYCNALSAGMSEFNLDKLQHVQNNLAHVVTGLRRRNHITPTLKELHLLTIWARIAFKVATVVYRVRERWQPPYLADFISDYVPTRTVWSSTKTLLAEPSFRTNIGRRSFRYVAAKTWNNLPDDFKTFESLSLFRKGLKTFLFSQSYCC